MQQGIIGLKYLKNNLKRNSMPYIYVKNKSGKVTSFYLKDKSVKVGNIIVGQGEVIRVKLTKRDS